MTVPDGYEERERNVQLRSDGLSATWATLRDERHSLRVTVSREASMVEALRIDRKGRERLDGDAVAAGHTPWGWLAAGPASGWTFVHPPDLPTQMAHGGIVAGPNVLRVTVMAAARADAVDLACALLTEMAIRLGVGTPSDEDACGVLDPAAV